jgi:hypothetical protein
VAKHAPHEPIDRAHRASIRAADLRSRVDDDPAEVTASRYFAVDAFLQGARLVKEAGRALVVLLAFALEPLRRLTSPQGRARWQRWIAPVLLLAAAVVFLRWGSEPAPERISLGDLAAGKLSSTQTWIIVSGELSEAPSDALSDRVYNLTDPSSPQARLLVRSDGTMPLGATTVSGQLTGGQLQPDGVSWWGELQADQRLAPESPPPLPAIALALAGVLVAVARQTTYPVYFPEEPAGTAGTLGSVAVTVKSVTGRPVDTDLPAMLEHGSDGGPATLNLAGMEPFPLIFHSPTTGIDVGGLRELGRLMPVLRVRTPAIDATISFASREDRDGAFVALTTGTHG